MPESFCRHITIRNINMDCENFFDVRTSDKYDLCDFNFENIKVTDKKNAFDTQIIDNTKTKNIVINGKKL